MPIESERAFVPLPPQTVHVTSEMRREERDLGQNPREGRFFPNSPGPATLERLGFRRIVSAQSCLLIDRTGMGDYSA